MPDVFSAALSLLGAGGAGGLFGALGAALTHWQERKRAAEERAHEIALLKARTEADLQLMKLEAQHADRQLAIRTDGQVEQAAYKALAESYKADRRTYGKGTSWLAWLLDLVDVVRGLTRPVLTAFLTWELTNLLAAAREIAKPCPSGFVAAEGAAAVCGEAGMLLQVTAAIIFLATTAVTWWFGTRPPKKAAPQPQTA